MLFGFLPVFNAVFKHPCMRITPVWSDRDQEGAWVQSYPRCVPKAELVYWSCTGRRICLVKKRAANPPGKCFNSAQTKPMIYF